MPYPDLPSQKVYVAMCMFVMGNIGHFRVPLQNRSNENEFDLHENEAVGVTHFHINCFAPSLVLTRRPKGTRKWPIGTGLSLLHLVHYSLAS